MIEKLSKRFFYNESCFSKDMFKKEVKGADADAPAKKWDDQDQFQLYHKELQ